MMSWAEAFIRGWQEAEDYAIKKEALALDKEKLNITKRMQSSGMKAFAKTWADYQAKNPGVSTINDDILGSDTFRSMLLMNVSSILSDDVGAMSASLKPTVQGLVTQPVSSTGPTQQAGLPAPLIKGPAVPPQPVGQLAPVTELLPLGAK